jgi:hypothetical protein
MLLEELRSLETELHTTEARRNWQRMEMLLHPDFVEFGRSGTRYTRADILHEFGPTTVPEFLFPTRKSTLRRGGKPRLGSGAFGQLGV